MLSARTRSWLGVLAVALGSAQAESQGAAGRAPCDIDAANAAIDRGWDLWRAGDVARADTAFRTGVRACVEARRGWTGLGYVALRRDSLSLAIARFDSAFAVSPVRDADEAIGLGLATFRAGQRLRAREAFLLADSLAPGDSLVAEYLRRLPAPIDPALLPRRGRPAQTQLAARTGRRILEVPDAAGGWRPFWVKAVNLGAALPGRHPSEFPPDDGTYDAWIRTTAELGANTIRLYTIHPPHFYRAIASWNRTHPERALWLLHGVWTELPPGKFESEYDDSTWNAAFEAEMRRVVDLLHGNAAIQPRAGHASGLYEVDVSRWTLGYILGREWEPYSVQAFAAAHPASRDFAGRYVRVSGGNAVDVWLAQAAEHLLAYEMERYNAQRPLAYTNWPTLDPLTHPTESSRAEEAAWISRRRERVPEASMEYDNDLIALDARRMTATDSYAAGLFASYHAYPYYPEFMVVDPAYGAARGREGTSAYLGYLRELVAHHGDQPVIISEYGVPSSRGNAHLQPQGWDHGGHDEAAQARINARLTREIAESGAAGAGVFALIDEWFKKNWMVLDFERPAERNRLWLNALDPEQHYGVIAMRAGVRDSAIRIDGQTEDWSGRTPWYAGDPADARLQAFWVTHDEAYVYLRLDVGTVDWTQTRYRIGIDTFDPRLGDVRFPGTRTRSPVGLEFVIELNGPGAARVLVDRSYSLYRFVPIRGAQPPAMQQIYARPWRHVANSDGRYDTLWVTPNRRTIGRDGTVFPAQRIERNLLRHARASETTLADWYADAGTGTIEIRLPWGMLHVLDPSSRQVLFGTSGTRDPGHRTTEGFRFVIESVDPRTGASVDRMPRGAGPDAFSAPPTWSWPAWETPRWYAERKPLFAAMQEAFAGIPEQGPPRQP
jgi:hypothetical protein